MREMMGDAWDELVGYDGRFLRTLRILLRHPGHLTNEVLQGRRARYIFPVRLYLFASFAYFLTATVAPSLATSSSGFKVSSDTVVVRLDQSQGPLSDEQRKELLEQMSELPTWLRPLAERIVNDPEGFKRSLLEHVPRVLFALVPLFAAVMKLFYRGGWVQHMTFSLHLHAGLFLMLIARELSKFSGNVIILGVFEVITLIAAISYTLMAIRTVYAERWSRVVLKFIPILAVYAIAYVLAVLIALAWTAAT
jgi:hypothetical protein